MQNWREFVERNKRYKNKENDTVDLTMDINNILDIKNGGLELSGCFWTDEIVKENDYVYFKNKNNTSGKSRYKLVELRWLRDPDDMYAYKAVHAPLDN